MSHRISVGLMLLGALLGPGPGWAGGPGAGIGMEGPQTSAQTERAILDAFDDEDDLDRLEVSVRGTEATVSGRAPHLFAKNRAIEVALAVAGIETVVSEIELPEGESDEDIAEDVARAVTRYEHYTLWDYLDGRINDGAVTLSGSVTADRDKKGDLYEAITKIRGVEEYVDNIEIQSTSRDDQRLRSAISSAVFQTESFQRFRTMTNPPFHIVVNRARVTLVGYVQSDIEYRELERIIRQTPGVFRVDNQLQRP